MRRNPGHQRDPVHQRHRAAKAGIVVLRFDEPDPRVLPMPAPFTPRSAPIIPNPPACPGHCSGTGDALPAPDNARTPAALPGTAAMRRNPVHWRDPVHQRHRAAKAGIVVLRFDEPAPRVLPMPAPVIPMSAPIIPNPLACPGHCPGHCSGTGDVLPDSTGENGGGARRPGSGGLVAGVRGGGGGGGGGVGISAGVRRPGRGVSAPLEDGRVSVTPAPNAAVSGDPGLLASRCRRRDGDGHRPRRDGGGFRGESNQYGHGSFALGCRAPFRVGAE